MILRSRTGWQTMIADLSLILFMIAANGLKPHPHPAAAAAPVALPARAEPVAVFRVQDGSPSLSQWLTEQSRDDRQRLTIVARYPAGGLASASSSALALASEAEKSGEATRVVLEQSAKSDLFAVLAFDRTNGWHDDCTSFADTRGASPPTEDRRCD